MVPPLQFKSLYSNLSVTENKPMQKSLKSHMSCLVPSLNDLLKKINLTDLITDHENKQAGSV